MTPAETVSPSPTDVRAARKLAGLNDAFPKSDPLLVKFADHMQMTGKAANDISNKVT